jgi:hypothetical protein
MNDCRILLKGSGVVRSRSREPSGTELGHGPDPFAHVPERND